jgi:hypothetical protein
MHLRVLRGNGSSYLKNALDTGLLLTGLAAAITFVAATPYVFLNFRQTIKDAIVIGRFVEKGFNQSADYGWHGLLFKGGQDTFGISLELLCIASVPWALLRRRNETDAIATFVIVVVVGLGLSHLAFDRYLLPIVPATALLVGIPISDIYSFLKNHCYLPIPALLLAVSISLILLPNLIRDIRINRLLNRDDTRTKAREWIVRHIPKGSTIAVKSEIDDETFYGKPQLPEGYSIESFPSGLAAALDKHRVEWVLFDTLAPLSLYSTPPSKEELEALNRNAILVFDTSPEKAGTDAAVFDENDAFYAPIRGLGAMDRPGPRIRIWMLSLHRRN